MVTLLEKDLKFPFKNEHQGLQLVNDCEMLAGGCTTFLDCHKKLP